MSDIVEQMANYRISQIELAEARYYEDLIRALDKIEKEVIAYAGTLPIKEGKLFELKAAVASRPIIREILEREYLAWSDKVVREGYSKQAKRIERTFKNYWTYSYWVPTINWFWFICYTKFKKTNIYSIQRCCKYIYKNNFR